MVSTASPISLTTAALAVAGFGALYALHHLRSRPARHSVATLIFWQRAAGPQRTRVPWAARFTHRRTFGLLSTIVLLTALALSADRWTKPRDGDARNVIVIDTGALHPRRIDCG